MTTQFTIHNLQFTIYKKLLYGLVFLVIFIILHSLFSATAFAQTVPELDPSGGAGGGSPAAALRAATPAPSSDTTKPNKKVGFLGEKISPDNYGFLEHAANTLTYSLPNGMLCALAGISPISLCPGILKDASGGSSKQELLYNGVPGGGAIGGVTTYLAGLYSSPTSVTEYMADVGEHFGFAQPAYAQVPGSGAGILKPVLNLWKVVRNLSYLVFILIFLFVGVMIMFRQKINPQTVVSIQSALPGLVIGLILVTFSYFIAALLIDIGFVGVQMVAQLFSTTGLVNIFGNQAQIQSIARDSNLFSLFGNLAGYTFNNIGELSNGLQGTVNSVSQGSALASNGPILLTAVIGAIIGALIAGPPGLVGGAAVGGVAGYPIISILISLVLVVALLVQIVRLFLKLLTTYIALLVGTVMGPIIILSSSIPGRGGGIGTWWKGILANALVFPAVFGTILFAGLILGTDPKDWAATPPLFGGFSTTLLRTILAYGVILGAPAVPDIVKGALGVKGGITDGLTKQAAEGVGLGAAVTTTVGAGAARSAVNLGYDTTKLSGNDRLRTINRWISGKFGSTPWFKGEPK